MEKYFQIIWHIPMITISCLVASALIANKKLREQTSSLFYFTGIILTAIWLIISLSWRISIPHPELSDHIFIAYLASIINHGFIFLFLGIAASFIDYLDISINKQKPLKLLTLLIITFGFYAPIWYAKKYKEFGISDKSRWFTIASTMSFLPFIHLHLRQIFSANTENYMILAPSIASILLALTHLVNIFTLQKSISKKSEIEFNWIYTVLFGALYTQHRINKTNIHEQ